MTNAARFFSATAGLVALLPWQIGPSNAAGRSYQECQALAVERGVPIRHTHKVFQNYERFKAAGTVVHVRGLIARCMAGTG